MGLSNMIYAAVDGVTFGHLARKASTSGFSDQEALKAAVVTALSSVAITAALITTWANDFIHGSATSTFLANDDDDTYVGGFSNVALASIVGQLCLAAGLCSVLLSVITLAFVSYVDSADMADFIKNHSRKLGLPLMFLGGTMLFYFVSTYLHVVNTTEDATVQTTALVILGIEAGVFVLFFIGMTCHSFCYSDMEFCDY